VWIDRGIAFVGSVLGLRKILIEGQRDQAGDTNGVISEPVGWRNLKF
jgi:hypothetical protein